MNPEEEPIIELIFAGADGKPMKPRLRRKTEAEAFAKEFVGKGYKLISSRNVTEDDAKKIANAKTKEAKDAAIIKEQENRAAVTKTAARNAVKADVGSAPRSFVSGVFDGLSSNFVDEVAGVASPALKERMRRNVDVQKSESPNAYAAGQMAGSVGQQLGLTRLIPGMKTPAGQMAYSGIEGAISGIGQEEAVTPASALYTAVAGAGGGLIGQVAGTALGRAGSGALKKLVGNTNLEGALQIEERLAKEALGKQLADFNASKATGIMLKKAAAEEAAKDAAQQLKIPGFIGMPTAARDAEKAYSKQLLADKAKIKAVAENFQTQYPDPFSVGGAIGSSLGSAATDLQSYQNMLTEKLISGNDAINAANKAMAGAIDVTVPNFVEVAPIDNRSVVNKALDRLIEMNAAKKASTSNADLTAIAERLGRE